MFRIGKVINFYEKIGITIVQLSGNLEIGDTIKIFKDGEEISTEVINKILVNQQNVTFAKAKDVVALVLNGKVQKGSEIYRVSELGARS